ncbi:MAG: PEP/pyruvate-binding domain-containing protein [Xanthobacteraceae bacterium]
MLRWLSELTDADFAAVGPKVARLAALRELGVEVPDGFAVTTGAFRTFLASNSLEAVIDRELASVTETDNFAAAEAVSQRLRSLVEQAPLEASFEAALREAYDELCFRYGDVALPVAVRSSAAGEDAAAASFAGQYESYLGIIGAEAVVTAVRQAWGSLFVARALSYRLRQKQHYRDTPMAVGVLRLVHARCAGVAFSADPVSKKRDRFIIEGAWGWGESVVQGTVEPDHVEVDRTAGRIIAYRVGEKRVASVFDRVRGGVTEQQLPARFHQARCLTDEMVRALWTTIAQIEQQFERPIDIEWVIEPGWRPGIPVSVVQVRPISTLDGENASSPPPKWDALGYATKYGLGIKPAAEPTKSLPQR